MNPKIPNSMSDPNDEITGSKASISSALFDDSQVELDPNAVKPGMHVSILRWKSHRDFSWVGDIFHVVSVNAPFVVVNLRKKHRTSRMVLDVRAVALRELTKDFVEAAEVSRELSQPEVE
jgi:hypothetical protein